MNAQNRKCMWLLPVLLAASGTIFEQALALKPEPSAPGMAQPVAAPEGIAWPQRFELSGREPASFGFAVTQVGPIHVEVQTQGAPVRVALVGPRQAEQAGTGRIALDLSLTPQDIRYERNLAGKGGASCVHNVSLDC
jgi:hypothetical protein